MKKLIAVLFISFAGFAQPEWETFTNTNYVNDIELLGQYVYAATSGGLLKQSVEDFSITRIDNQDGLPSVNCKALAVDSTGNLWIGAYDGALTKMDPSGKLTVYTAYKVENWMIEKISAYKGYLIVTADKGVSLFSLKEGLAVVNFTDIGGIDLGVKEIKDAAVVSDTLFVLMYAATDSNMTGTRLSDSLAFVKLDWSDLNSINLFDPAIWRFRRASAGGAVTSIGQFGGVLVISGGNEVVDICDTVYVAALSYWKNWIQMPLTGLSASYIATFGGVLTAITGDAQCRLWAGTDGGGIIFFDGSEWRGFPQPGPVDNFSHHIFKDKAGDFWVSTGALPLTDLPGAGVSRYNDGEWTSFSAANVAEFRGVNRITSIVQHPNGDLLFSLFGGGIAVRKSNGKWSSFHTGNSALTYNYVTGISFDAFGRIWASVQFEGFVVMDTSGIGRLLPTNMLNDNIFVSTIDDSNNLWAGYWDPYYKVFDTLGNDISYQFKSGDDAGGSIYSIRMDDSNNVWLARDGGYHHFGSHDSLIWHWRDTLSGEKITDIAFSPSSIVSDEPLVWAASHGKGLKLLKRNGELVAFYTEENSHLVSNKINGLCFDTATAILWIATEEGISLFRTGIFPVRTSFDEFYLKKVASRGRNYYEFNNIPDLSDIRIYTIDGYLVRQIKADSQRGIRWLLDNNRGNRVKPGVYFYTIRGNESGDHKGKLLVR